LTKVLLVNPNRLQAPYPVAPAGLALLAESLGSSCEIRLYDGCFQGAGGLQALLESFQPDLIGLGIRNLEQLDMLRPASCLEPIEREFLPLLRRSPAPLVLGGSGFSLLPQALMARLGADYGVVGEGERALPALVRALRAGQDPEAIPGVITRQGHRARVTRCAPQALRPARLWRHLDYGPYRQRGAYPLQTKRGCPRRCVYCSYPGIEGRRFRLRSPAAVVDELEEVRQALGPVTVELCDSTFNDPPGHAEAICREIERRDLGLPLRTMGLNPANANAELLALMRRAGFTQLDCTPDSAAPAMLENLGKGFDAQALRRCAAAIQRADMPTMWFFLLGGPGESEATVAQTLAFVDERVSPLDLVYLSPGLRIYPDTALHRLALRRGMVASDDPLLEPRWFVEPELGAERLCQLIEQAAAERCNCLPSWQSRPSAEMMAQALRLRREQGLQEPVFRTLLRLRAAGMR